MTRLLIILFISVSLGYARTRPCSDADAQRAESEADMFRSWNTLYHSYELYHQCDDGAVSEGYSESVARILVDHWETLPQLAQLAKKNPGFRHFILKHVDETLDVNDVRTISANAKTRCPNALQVLCEELRKQADAP